jgi:arylsulfatase A-like enzyme
VASEANRRNPERASTFAETTLLAVWLGLLTAAAEAALLLIKRHVQGQMIDVGPHFIWLLALADIAIFVAVAWSLAGAVRLTGRRLPASVLLFVLCWCGGLAVLLHYRPIAMYARFVLAAGAASVFAALAARQWPGFVRLARYGSAILLLSTGLTDVLYARGLIGGTPASAAGSTTASSPNILLLILDTVAARDLSLYGHARRTSPNLEAFAKRGTVFDHAFSTAPWTVPSHASMFTGAYPFRLTADWLTPLDGKPRTLAEVLGGEGYASALVGANRFLGREYGLHRGFSHISVYSLSAAEALRTTSIGHWLDSRNNWVRRLFRYYRPIARRSAADINADFLGWLERQDGRAFLGVLNYMDAHAPYVAPAPFDTLFEVSARRTNPMLGPDWTEEAIEAERAAYDEAIAHVDHHVGRLLEELDRRGVLDNTIVVVTADHGEQFGEHGHMEHSPSLYLNSLWVPLIIVAPGHVPRGLRLDAPVTLRDLPATLLDLAGVEQAPVFPGGSLARFWDPVPDSAEVVVTQVSQGIRTAPSYPISRGDMTSLIEGRYHFILNGDGRTELYDYQADPLEARDLVWEPSHAELVGHFEAMLGPFSRPRGIWPARQPR